ncbi:unnamed protein product [Rhizophagus irregularis]|nr:unnamed protein product [Rhizophagus irregularis]
MKIHIKLNLCGTKRDLNQISTSNPKIPIFQRDSSLPNHLKQPIKRKFHYILPRPPLKDINQSRLPSQS